MGEARWIIPFPEIIPGLGQRSHASLGQSQMFRSLASYLSETSKHHNTRYQRSAVRSQDVHHKVREPCTLIRKSAEVTMQIKSAKDLIVYQKAYALAMEIFKASEKLQAEENIVD